MFTSDERGLVEPNSDLVAMAIAVIGFVIFVALVAHTYQVSQQTTYIVQHYGDAVNLAELLMRDPALYAPGRPDLLDAARIEGLTAEDVMQLEERYGRHYNFSFKVEVPPSYIHIVGASADIGVSASVPATIRLNEATEMPGTFSVKIWGK